MKTKEKKVRGRTDEPEAAGISVRAMAQKYLGEKVPGILAAARSKGHARAALFLTTTDSPEKLERADKPLYGLLRKAGMDPVFEKVRAEDLGYRKGAKRFKLMVAVPQ